MGFELSAPFPPFAHLLSIVPAASSQVIPEFLRPLLTDPHSEISDFYPNSFFITRSNKKTPWESLAVLPFIDEKRLSAAYARALETAVPTEDLIRNMTGAILLYTLAYNTNLCLEHNEITDFIRYMDNVSIQTSIYIITHPPYTQKSCILPGVRLPFSEIDEELYWDGDRKAYGGSFFTGIVSRGIPADLISFYRTSVPLPIPSLSNGSNN